MVKPHPLFLRSLVLLSLALAHPVPAQANGPVMAGVAGPGVNLIYAYLAQDAGMWKKHGLDVRVVLFDSGSTLTQVARTGEVKFAINSGPGTIAARTQGADAVMVAAVVNTLPYSLVATKGITKWADLKGKKIGISRIGSGTDTAIRLLCKKFGLDPTKDIIILQGGTQPSRLQALSVGALDATLVSPPLDLTAKKQGFSVLVNVAELGILYPQLVIETSDRFNRENPQMALEMHRFKATAIRQRGIADDLQLHQLREQVRSCVRNQHLGHTPTYAAFHLQFRIVTGQKSLALISWPRYDNAHRLATGTPMIGGIAKW